MSTRQGLPDAPDGAFASVQEDAGDVPAELSAPQAAPAQPEVPAPGSQSKGANVATLAQLNRKKLDEMTDGELQQLSALLPADHKRQPKIQKAIQDRATQAQPATNIGAKEDAPQAPQAPQAQQNSTQQPQAGTAQDTKPATEPAGQPATSQSSTPAAGSVTNGPSTTANTGAQASGPQAQDQTKAPTWVPIGSDARSINAANRDVDALNRAADGYQYRVVQTKKGYQVERAELSSSTPKENAAPTQSPQAQAPKPGQGTGVANAGVKQAQAAPAVKALPDAVLPAGNAAQNQAQAPAAPQQTPTWATMPTVERQQAAQAAGLNPVQTAKALKAGSIEEMPAAVATKLAPVLSSAAGSEAQAQTAVQGALAAAQTSKQNQPPCARRCGDCDCR